MKSLLALVFLFIVGGGMFAQQPNNARGDRANEILQQLDLSPLQREKIDQLRQKYTDLFEHNARTTPVRKERMEKRRRLQRDLRLEMREILTPSQQRKFKDLNSRADQGSKPDLQESLRWTKPSPEQQQQIQTLLAEQKKKLRQLRQQSMTEVEKRGNMRKIKMETIESLKNILSAEQFKIFKEHISLRVKRQTER